MLKKNVVMMPTQTVAQGAINCSSGKSVSLKDQADRFIAENDPSIQFDIGAFSDRVYESPMGLQ